MTSIGTKLCRPPTTPAVEYSDRLSLDDVRQDTALRALLALRKIDNSVDQDIGSAFDRHPGIVVQAYKWAYQDALRKKLGRSETTRITVIGEGQIVLDRLEAPTADDVELIEIEQYPESDLTSLYRYGITGMSIDKTRKIIDMMVEIQRMKDNGQERVPDALRQRLKRLRVETGLALDIKLL